MDTEVQRLNGSDWTIDLSRDHVRVQFGPPPAKEEKLAPYCQTALALGEIIWSKVYKFWVQNWKVIQQYAALTSHHDQRLIS